MSILKMQLLTLILLFPFHSFGEVDKKNFFDQRYRGWIWFDEKDIETTEPREEFTKIPTKEEMLQAKSENEQFSEELELLKHMMIRYPENVDYVVMYKRKELEMQEKSHLLGKNWAKANFLNPDIIDELENPQNIYGRKIYREEKKKADTDLLKKVALEVDLFVFRQDGCPYCADLEKHLANFANTYGFNVEAISPDRSKSKYFETNQNLELIKSLGLEVMPTVIAVVKSSRERYELARGAVSIADLENSSLILGSIIEEKRQKEIKG